MSVLDGPGEGTWSVFAQKVVEERDQLRDHVESLKAQLECAQAFHNVALRERDLAITQMRHAEADAEQAVAYAEQERERAERECDVLIEILAHEFDWKDTSYLHAAMHVENAIRNLRADVRAQEFQTGLVAQALAGKVARTDAVNRLLSANGCDCECNYTCEDGHDENCERCLACRIDAALNGKDEP